MQLWRTIIDAKGGNYAIMKSQKCNYATVLEPCLLAYPKITNASNLPIDVKKEMNYI